MDCSFSDVSDAECCRDRRLAHDANVPEYSCGSSRSVRSMMSKPVMMRSAYSSRRSRLSKSADPACEPFNKDNAADGAQPDQEQAFRTQSPTGNILDGC